MKTNRGSGGKAPRLLNLGSRSRLVVGFDCSIPGESVHGTSRIGGLLIDQ
jgi:hypothetical protein